MTARFARWVARYFKRRRLKNQLHADLDRFVQMRHWAQAREICRQLDRLNSL